MLSARGDRGVKGGRDADHFRPHFPIVVQKRDIENISRTEDAMAGRKEFIAEDNGITQKIIVKLR
jgi:hypothetical protein